MRAAKLQPKSRFQEVTRLALTLLCLACSEVFFGRDKTGGITHVKIDDLQMRVGVSGQTLWAVNEGAQPNSERERLALHGV